MLHNGRVALIAMIVAIISLMALSPSRSSQAELTPQERFANCCGDYMGH